jgi:hypothetical protein
MQTGPASARRDNPPEVNHSKSEGIETITAQEYA